jgi:LysM repeat protein
MNVRRKHVSGARACMCIIAASAFVIGLTVAMTFRIAEEVQAPAPAVFIPVTQKSAQTGQEQLLTVSYAGGTYTVLAGDSLSRIAGEEYGDAACWPGIWRANSKRITDPNVIYTGQELQIPVGCGSSGVEEEAYTAPAPERTTPPPAPSGGGESGFYDSVLSFGQIEALWVDAGGPGWAEYNAAEIAECESGGNRYAYNDSGATGIWQILGQVADYGESLDDPWVNAANAVSKFEASGDTFAQWVCTA